jgi:uncharacterized protein
MGLTERVERNVDLSFFEGSIPVNYRYTYGLGMEKFFQSIKEKGELLGCRCPGCGAVYFPCRIFCERCFSEISRTIKLPGTGTIYSFTVCHLNMDGTRKKEPDVVGLVDMDGGEGAKFVHLINAKPDKVETGRKVKMVLKPKKERKGGIFDIKGFRLA